jgi:hypothetical protein
MDQKDEKMIAGKNTPDIWKKSYLRIDTRNVDRR